MPGEGLKMLRKLIMLVFLTGSVASAPQLFKFHQDVAQSSISEKGLATAEFPRLIEKISEPGGFFDTDNLISNEASYLHVLGKLRKMGVEGGAYIGVGPDQNFSYIAQIRPKIAYIVDIRRDNVLEHLLFKAIFSISRNRVEYLLNLVGRNMPAQSEKWNEKTINDVAALVDAASSDRARFEALHATVLEKIKAFGVPLTDIERSTISRIHQAFFASGLDLRFTSRARPPRFYYPTYRDLLLERDLSGRQANFLATEESFQVLKDLEAKNLVVPVVGDFGGDRALRAVARDISERGLKVSAFYTSNVEFYLMREGGFDRWVENLKRLPIDPRSVIIRSYFSGSFGHTHPQTVTGYYSTQLLQTIESLIKEHSSGGYETYTDLVTKQSLDLR
jgi:hypothetical protein